MKKTTEQASSNLLLPCVWWDKAVCKAKMGLPGADKVTIVTPIFWVCEGPEFSDSMHPPKQKLL